MFYFLFNSARIPYQVNRNTVSITMNLNYVFNCENEKIRSRHMAL